jgi:hypothetical protein
LALLGTILQNFFSHFDLIVLLIEEVSSAGIFAQVSRGVGEELIPNSSFFTGLGG